MGEERTGGRGQRTLGPGGPAKAPSFACDSTKPRSPRRPSSDAFCVGAAARRASVGAAVGGLVAIVGEAVGAAEVTGRGVGATEVGDPVGAEVGAVGEAVGADVGAVGDAVGDVVGAVGDAVGDIVGAPVCSSERLRARAWSGTYLLGYTRVANSIPMGSSKPWPRSAVFTAVTSSCA